MDSCPVQSDRRSRAAPGSGAEGAGCSRRWPECKFTDSTARRCELRLMPPRRGTRGAVCTDCMQRGTREIHRSHATEQCSLEGTCTSNIQRVGLNVSSTTVRATVSCD